MSQNQAYKLYAQQQVMTASPAKLVFMAYEHIITSLNEAIKAIEEKDIERRWKANNKACDIIGYLWSTLDMEGGGEIAVNLDRLFAYVMSKLPQVDFKNDPQPAIDAIKLMEPLRNAWKELSEKMSESQLAEAVATARGNQPASTQSDPAPATAPAPTNTSQGYGAGSKPTAPTPASGVSVSA